MADDNIFDFEEFKKRLDELKKEQEKKKSEGGDSFSKMFEMYSNLFKPPSQEEVDKAVVQLADSLEKAAKVIREMQSDTEEKKEDDTEGEEE